MRPCSFLCWLLVVAAAVRHATNLHLNNHVRTRCLKRLSGYSQHLVKVSNVLHSIRITFGLVVVGDILVSNYHVMQRLTRRANTIVGIRNLHQTRDVQYRRATLSTFREYVLQQVTVFIPPAGKGWSVTRHFGKRTVGIHVGATPAWNLTCDSANQQAACCNKLEPSSVPLSNHA